MVGRAVAVGAVTAAAVVAGWAALGRARRAVVIGAGAMAVAVLLAVAGAAWTGVVAARHLDEGRAAAGLAVALASDGDQLAAAAAFRRAERAFAAAGDELRRWPGALGRRLPVVSDHLDAVAVVAGAGEEASRAAGAVVVGVDSARLAIRGGRLDLEAVNAAGPVLDRAARRVAGAEADVRAVPRRWLVGPASRALDDVADELGEAHRALTDAAGATRVVPAMLGAEGPRRWFVAMQNPAEARASGGIIASFVVLEADRGKLRLVRTGRSDDVNLAGDPEARRLLGPSDYVRRYARFEPQRTWQNVTMSPDFPSVATVIERLYPQSGGDAVDGVLSVDPVALAALLRVTGPVQVAGWPEPLTARNATRVLLTDQYTSFPDGDRVEFLAAVTDAVFTRIADGDLPQPGTLASALGASVREGHLMVHSARSKEQAMLEELGLTGAMRPVAGDYLQVVTQNAGANKLDAFLRRDVRYQADVDARTGAAVAEARVTLSSSAPTAGLPGIVIDGAYGRPGQNRTYLSVYTPLELEGATVDGRPLLMESADELGRRVYSAYVDVPAGGEVDVVLSLAGRVTVARGYRLDVERQPSVHADRMALDLAVGKRQRVRAEFELDEDRTFALATAARPRPAGSTAP